MNNDKIKEILTRGVGEVIEEKDLNERLNSTKKLRIKLGIDPTSPNIHIGRAVVLLKLRQFQELGHKAVLIVGDFTGMIGDTSDKDSERPMLSEAEVKKNMKSYFGQAFKILDPKKTETHYNSKWLKKLGFIEIGKMADLFSLHEFEARENIAKRLKAAKRVSLREFVYPIMVGYDSVAVKADVELGGTDQRFNLLAGRVIQPVYGQRPQNILTTVLMEGTDGRKMSSSWGNVINITDEPNDMFGKVMSIHDDLIKKYFVLATRVEISEIEEIVKLPNPRDQKIRLAQEIVTLYNGAAAAEKAKLAFISQFSKGELPEDIKEISRTKISAATTEDLLVALELVASKNEARRNIEQGGVKIDGKKITEKNQSVDLTKINIVQVGKRKLVRLI